MKNIFLLLVFIAIVSFATAQKTKAAALQPPALSSIRESDLRSDIFTMAGDSMRGRRAGTQDELRAAVWVADQARKAGLQPAGDDGTYFQFFPLKRIQVTDSSTLQINGQSLILWKDAWITTPVESTIQAPVLWLNALADTSRPDINGKVIAMMLQPPVPLPAPGMSLWEYRYALSAIRQQSNSLKNHGAKAILLVADERVAANTGFLGHVMKEGIYGLEGMPLTQPLSNIPVILVHPSQASSLQQAGTTITVNLHTESYTYPSVNVVAKVNGTDAVLKNEYVVFSGHHDHDGIGAPVAGDSIWNGADDNASVGVALLAIGKAWASKPGKRSALFIWHGAEERGLLGSRWYAEHPTVKKEALVAVLNGDMIGRNNPDSAALLGVTYPHRNSTQLAQMAMQANTNLTHFKIDTTWDDPKHPENWYFRSDHLPYARANIPAIMFTTLLHPDYHTPKDEPQRIDIAKLARMTRWIYATGWMVANAAQRPALDPAHSLQ